MHVVKLWLTGLAGADGMGPWADALQIHRQNLPICTIDFLPWAVRVCVIVPLVRGPGYTAAPGPMIS